MIRVIQCALLALILAASFDSSAKELLQGDADITLVSLQRQVTGTYYIAGELEGYGAVDFLVDTGSSYTVINEDILEKLKRNGDARFDRELEGVMANGARMSIPLYRLSGIRLGRDCWLDDVDAAVFPDATRAILGMNVLTRLAPFTFMANPPGLALTQCGQQESASAKGAAAPLQASAAPAPQHAVPAAP